MSNAVKYGSRARVQLREEEDCIIVEINDDGPGIPESEQEKVFAPFYRIERSRSRDTGARPASSTSHSSLVSTLRA